MTDNARSAPLTQVAPPAEAYTMHNGYAQVTL